jgi:hypothetical protein
MTHTEVQRILSLPRRTWDDATTARAVDLLTAAHRTPTGTMVLRPLQAQMLADAHGARGLFAAAGVGTGKTLTSFLLPVVLRVSRPLLLVPASLVEKSRYDLRALRQHWLLTPEPQIWSYDTLSSVRGEERLQEYAPDCIIADECHRLKDAGAARTRRFLRYMKAREQAGQRCIFCGLSGTITRKSLREYWHLVGLALNHSSPVPLDYDLVQRWSMILDSDSVQRMSTIGDFVSRPPPPRYMLDWEPTPGGTPWERARRGVQRRMSSTPGCVFSTQKDSTCESTLIVRRLSVQPPKEIDQALHTLRTSYETPNGDELQNATEVWRHARELQCGFWYRWEPRPPQPWLRARREWHAYVRQVLERNEPGLDSPMQIGKRYADHPLHKAWTDIRETFTINTIPEWVSDYLVREAIGWLRQGGKTAADGAGIIWVEHRAVGQRLALLASHELGREVPFFADGPDAGRRIVTWDGPMIASWHAHREGKNLQHYRRSLVLSPPPAGDAWDQLLGRLHRPGQQSDEVEYDVALCCREACDSFGQAMKDAAYIEDTTGNPQKLLRCTLVGRFDE